ncbi:hypothetical protein FACS189490_04830 [Clostridia bacterium]|nr:hypothetical protein FACS189490_04830 [Clostridia bacterium]
MKQSGLLLVDYYRNNLRSYLKLLDANYPGIVNPPSLADLDYMSKLFSGNQSGDLWLNECVDPSITNFAMLHKRSVREKVDQYVTEVSTTDNRIQWALFMPDFVKKQVGDSGIEVAGFEYRRMSAFKFIGVETDDNAKRDEIFRALDAMPEYKSGFDHDLLFQHHYGREIDNDEGKWHGVWGRFMSADSPVPEGFLSFDFVPEGVLSFDGVGGSPYLSSFAFATFTGDVNALHKTEGFDSDAMYDITRNIILGEDVIIPYPQKYWTAEVFLNGYIEPSSGYLFSVELDFDGGGKYHDWQMNRNISAQS